jgi:signal transduction histidine kinase/CheY-like chemotaxis protein/HAMP domain-containing protein
MKLKDLKISVQLRLGLGLILFFVLALGAVSWYQAHRLWLQTEGIYSHPLKVRRALSDLRYDILVIQRCMRESIFAENAESRREEMQLIAERESNAFRQLDTIYKAYLGLREDVITLNEAMEAWKPIREEVFKVLESGKKMEAFAMTSRHGISGVHVDRIMGKIERISDFARKKSDSFYLEADMSKTRFQNNLLALVVLLFVLSFGISLLLIDAIRKPLGEMLRVTDDYREGNLDARIEYSSNNEFGMLASSFNRLAEEGSRETRLRENAASIANIMLREEQLNSFCTNLLEGLLKFSGSYLGLVYLLDPDKKMFVPGAGIGVRLTASLVYSASEFEGDLGLSLKTKQIELIREIPSDSRMILNTSAGDFLPREMLTVPVLSGNEVVAMISLASMKEYDDEAVQLVQDILPAVTARFNGVLAHQKIMNFSRRLEDQNRELDERAKELAVQGNELTEQNIELEMQKTQLDEANRLKSTFLSNMSHELRTPLNSVIALSGVLSRRLKDRIPQDEFGYLEIIERNGKNLLALINDLLDLSRIEAGHEEISLTSFNVADLAEEVFSMLQPQAESKNIIMENFVPQNLSPVRSDYVKCRHILQNLLANAVKFTSRGSVKIGASIVEKEVHIRISDTGIGISGEDLKYIFDEFRQVDSGSSRKFGGTGLGLSIARKYARMLHGEIRVESEPGKGSVFTLILPMVLEVSDSPKNETREIPEQIVKTAKFHLARSGAGKTILLFEDSEPAIILITEILTEQGFTLHVARTGTDAVEKIRLFKPHAIILDLMMPETDGFQVLKMIRETPQMAHVPVLILTAKQITKSELSFLKGNHIHQLIQKGDIGKAELLSAVDSMVNPPTAETEVKPVVPGREVAPGRSKPLILIVEDNPDNMRTTRALLQEDYDILEAIDGEEGVRLALSCKPDLILMDMALPGMDGFQAFDQIRDSEEHRHIPIVALTASAMKGSREQILEYGFDDYVSKPIEQPFFVRVLNHYLGNRGKG